MDWIQLFLTVLRAFHVQCAEAKRQETSLMTIPIEYWGLERPHQKQFQFSLHLSQNNKERPWPWTLGFAQNT